MARYSRLSMLDLLSLALFILGSRAQLKQAYCSDQNTGSSNRPNFSIYQSNGLCFDACKSQYAFAVVQYQNCWCSDFIPSNQLDTGGCDQKCPGFPEESCGNQDNGLFGYIALPNAPSGTAGASSAAQTSAPQTRPGRPFSPPFTPGPPSPSSSEDPPTSTAPTTETPTPSSSTSSTSSSSSLSSTEAEAPVTSTQVVTVSGAIVTQTVTSTPRPRTSGTAADNLQEKPSQSSTPTGVIVGAAVGSIAGIAILLSAFFLLWRRRRNNNRDSGNSGINRNPSVLSKAGLLSTGRTTDPEKSMEEPRFGSQRQSALYDPPESPTGGPAGIYETSSHPSRRNSRPLYYDQRLNPAAIMQDWEGNGSRTSIGTMQDQRDYSRPLGIANPDVERD